MEQPRSYIPTPGPDWIGWSDLA